jgi:putative peptidoglycan lipid II flippase
MYNALVSIAINIVLSLALFPFIGFVAVAIATSLASWIQVALLAFRLHRRGQFKPDARLMKRSLPMLAATAALCAATWLSLQHTDEMARHLLGREWIAVVLIACMGVALYGLLSLALGAVRPSDFTAHARKRPPIDAA